MLTVVVTLAYVSLVLELVLTPVPSVVSAVQLASAEQAAAGSRWLRYRWFIPVLINNLTWVWPLFLVWREPATFGSGSSAQLTLLAVLGVVLVVAGRSLTIASALYLRKVVKPNIGHGDLNPPLTVGGPFRYSRNPGLVGMYCLALGLLCLVPNLAFVAGLCFYLWHMHRRIKMEEQHLTDAFGQAFRDYMQKVPRYV